VEKNGAKDGGFKPVSRKDLRLQKYAGVVDSIGATRWLALKPSHLWLGLVAHAGQRRLYSHIIGLPTSAGYYCIVAYP